MRVVCVFDTYTLFYFCAEMETGALMIPIVNRIRTSTAKRTTSSVAASNRVFDFRWNDLIKKTTQIPQQSAASNL